MAKMAVADAEMTHAWAKALAQVIYVICALFLHFYNYIIPFKVEK